MAKGEGRAAYKDHLSLLDGIKDNLAEYGLAFAVFVGGRCDFVTSDKDSAIDRARGLASFVKPGSVRIRSSRLPSTKI